MKARIEHLIEISADEFFDRVFFNEDYNSKLFEVLRFRERELIEQKDENGTVRRVVRQVPEREIPGAVRKVMGVDRFEFKEVTTYFKGQRRADIDVQSSVMPEKIKVGGKFWVEPAGDGQCRRFFDVEVNVSIFGIGGMMEKIILNEVKESYDQAAVFTNRYIKENLG